MSGGCAGNSSMENSYMRKAGKPVPTDGMMLVAILALLILSVGTALWGKAVHGQEVVRRPVLADKIEAMLVSHGLPTWFPAHLQKFEGLQ